MRISLFTEVFPPKIDGITNRLTHTIRALRAEGHVVQVVAPEGVDRRHPGIELVTVPAVPFARVPGLSAGLPDPRIASSLAAFDPDVVHLVGPACLGVWGALAAAGQGRARVASYHTDLPRYVEGYGLGWIRPALWPWLRAVHNSAHLNLCPSEATRRELIARGIRNVGLWRGGVDADRFHPRQRSLAMRARLCDGRPDGPLLLNVGRLAPEKGLDTLLPLLDAIPSARLALVGDGPDRLRLERLFRGRPVHFAGFLRGEELARAYASADVFVMPSTTETLGFVALEAMASGLPVVAADAGGLQEIVRPGENGLLFEPREPESLVGHVQHLLESRATRLHLARMGRKTAENASWESETRALVRVYREAIGRARRTPLGRLKQHLRALRRTQPVS